MSRSSGTTLGVIALIIAVGGIALSGFSTLTLITQSTPVTQARAYRNSPDTIDDITWESVDFNA